MGQGREGSDELPWWCHRLGELKRRRSRARRGGASAPHTARDAVHGARAPVAQQQERVLEEEHGESIAALQQRRLRDGAVRVES
jgi:hypothetical protein